MSSSSASIPSRASRLISARVTSSVSCAIGRSSRLAEDRRAIAKAFVSRVDRVAQPALLADLGEQTSGGVTSQDRGDGAGLIIIGSGNRLGGIGERNLNLLCFLDEMIALRSRGLKRNGRIGARFPIREQPRHGIAEAFPFDGAGDSEDRAVGSIIGFDERSQVVGFDRRNTFGVAERGTSPRVGKMTARSS